MKKHLEYRKCFDPAVTYDEVSASFPLYNFMGQLVGYQKYTPHALKQSKVLKPDELKYFTYTPTHKVTAYGLHLLDSKYPYVFLVEGVFDACRLHRLGFNALAVLSCDPKHLKQWLGLLPYKLLALVDGDAAGLKLAKYADAYVQCPTGEDVSSIDTSVLYNLINQLLKAVD